ncbi:ionotropic receptor 93a-like [Dermacentor andersoni]|uniref:ionotropic receptor 93a-like n=1 Tax=Dermacentor andersoni TaxID=34620 RepID=UPI002418073F|nr:ionotropic receptor 93a-like [Dermacentor andersoni]
MPYIISTPAPGGLVLEGPIATMMEIISRASKKKLLVVNQNETIWGFKLNGSYTGYLGLIARGDSDVFVGPVMPTVERMEMGEITPSYVFTEMHFMTPKPSKYVDAFAFASSFSVEVWFGLFISMLIISATFTLDKCVQEKNAESMLRKFGSSLWLCSTYFFNAAKHERVTSVSTRILLGSWSLFLFVLVTLLSSRLVSTMLVKSTEDHVDTLDDVLRFPKLKIIVERKTGFEDFVMKPKTAFFKKLQRHVVLVQGSIVPGAVLDDVFDRVEGGGHVVLHERHFQDATLAARYARRGHCSFRRARQSLYLQPVGMMLRKGLKPDVKRTIKTHLRRAFEMGLQVRPMQPYIFNATRCYAEDPQEAAAYLLEDMQGAFFSLVLGLALSLGMFLTELTVICTQSFKLIRRPLH